MRIDAQGNSTKYSRKAFFRGRKPKPVKHFLDAATQSVESHCARAQIVVEKMRNFMCQGK
jgi:hypothetical protein